MAELLSISKVCELLHTTSRTLRFYEEKGLICSIRTNDSPIRYYTLEETERIRKILILRFLHLPLNEIKSLINQNNFIDSLNKQVQVLSSKQQALYQNYLTLCQISADSIHTVFELKKAIEHNTSVEFNSPEYRAMRDLSYHATDLLLQNKIDEFYSLFDEGFQEVVSMETVQSAWDSYPRTPGFARTIITSYRDENIFVVILQAETCKILITYSCCSSSLLSGVTFSGMD